MGRHGTGGPVAEEGPVDLALASQECQTGSRRPAMPTYEYACKSCGEHLEVVQSFRDDALTECPQCRGALKKLFGNVGIAFKGSGFYKTDSRSGSGSSDSSSPATSSGSDSNGSGSSSTPASDSSSAGSGSSSSSAPAASTSTT